MHKPGRYIVIEGLDGSGKTTQFNLLLQKLGSGVVGVREPGGTPMGENLRTALLNKDIPRAARTNLYILSAARADLVDTIIAPAVAQNKTVLSDRNWLSTFAYQAGGEGVDTAEILAVSRQATGAYFTPDLIIFIDTSVATCKKRMAASAKHGGKDYFDTKSTAFFTRVRRNYLHIIKTQPAFVIVDGEQAPAAVHAAVLAAIQHHLAPLLAA